MSFELKRELLIQRLRDKYNDMKQEAYQHLWDNSDDVCIFGIVEDKYKIIIQGDEISFDNGKTFINRREEKEIISEFNRVENEVIELILEIEKEELKKINAKDNVDGINNKSLDELILSALKNISSNQMDYLCNSMNALNMLDLIDNQIEILREILREIDRDKKKLFDLLKDIYK